MDLSFIVRPDFDSESHTYRVDGIIRPGVSQILSAAGLTEDYSSLDERRIAAINNAADRGTMVHLAVALDCCGELDEDSVDDEIWPYLESWRDFVADTGFVPVANELVFYEPESDYCGTTDLPGYIGNRFTIADLKTGSVGLKPSHKYATVAYARPFFLQEGTWPDRLIIHLRPELKRKKYREYHFSPAAAEWDWKVFAAARTIMTAKELDGKQS